MSIQRLAHRLMRGGEEAVELMRKLHAGVCVIPEREQRWVVNMGDETDDFIVGRFSYEADAREFAEDLNRALGPIVERRCLTVLSSCMNEMAEGLSTVEQG